MIRWIGKFTVARKRVADAWRDLQPEILPDNPEFQAALALRQNARAAAGEPLLDEVDAFREWRQRLDELHVARFPLGDNLFTLIL